MNNTYFKKKSDLKKNLRSSKWKKRINSWQEFLRQTCLISLKNHLLNLDR